MDTIIPESLVQYHVMLNLQIISAKKERRKDYGILHNVAKSFLVLNILKWNIVVKC